MRRANDEQKETRRGASTVRFSVHMNATARLDTDRHALLPQRRRNRTLEACALDVAAHGQNHRRYCKSKYYRIK
jgi:hypothetical protein